jgi:hypothetical protein
MPTTTDCPGKTALLNMRSFAATPAPITTAVEAEAITIGCFTNGVLAVALVIVVGAEVAWFVVVLLCGVVEVELLVLLFFGVDLAFEALDDVPEELLPEPDEELDLAGPELVPELVLPDEVGGDVGVTPGT